MNEFDFGIISTSLQLAFSSVLPFVLAAMTGGLVMGVLRSATQIDDKVFSIVGRLFCVILVAYVFLDFRSMGIIDFTRRIWGTAQFYY